MYARYSLQELSILFPSLLVSAERRLDVCFDLREECGDLVGFWCGFEFKLWSVSDLVVHASTGAR